MHELSIVMSIIDIASQQTEAAQATAVDEVELDIGSLSGVDMNAFDFAWEQAVKQTVLEHAVKKINHINAKANCIDCNTEFAVENYYDACPNCGGHLINILQGKELRVKALVVS